MIEIVRNIGNTKRLAAWLEANVRTHLVPDVSNYAKGRLRVWLNTEPSLTNPTRLSESRLQVNETLTKRLQEIIEWPFDYCLITYSGDDNAIGISPHRDASYADYEAYTLNLTGDALFEYWNERQSFGYSRDTVDLGANAPPTSVLSLTSGDLVHFNCKNKHAASPSTKRWSLNFWKAKAPRS